jgi:hypothetical protein
MKIIMVFILIHLLMGQNKELGNVELNLKYRANNLGVETPF